LKSRLFTLFTALSVILLVAVVGFEAGGCEEDDPGKTRPSDKENREEKNELIPPVNDDENNRIEEDKEDKEDKEGEQKEKEEIDNNKTGEDLDGDQKEEGLPVEVDKWVDYSRNIRLGQAVEDNGTLYILVTYGKKNTGGYEVEITEVVEGEDRLTVYAEFTAPAEDQPVTQVITRPYDLKELEATGLPVDFMAKGDEKYVPGLKGIEVLFPPVAESNSIKVFSPEPETEVSREFNLEGVANVFEGTVHYRLLLKEDDKKEIKSGITSGAMGDWGYFEEEIKVPEEIESGEKMLLELYTESPRDGRMQDLVKVALGLE